MLVQRLPPEAVAISVRLRQNVTGPAGLMETERTGGPAPASERLSKLAVNVDPAWSFCSQTKTRALTAVAGAVPLPFIAVQGDEIEMTDVVVKPGRAVPAQLQLEYQVSATCA